MVSEFAALPNGAPLFPGETITDDGHRRVVGWRSRISHNGSYHKVEAQILIGAHRTHTTKTGFHIEREMRAEPWTVFVPVYVGLDLQQAQEAVDRVYKLFEVGGRLTE